MNSTQTAQGDQKTASATSPFDQITELEKRENERVEKELAGLNAETEQKKAEIVKKEEEEKEQLRQKAKQDLKKYSETELSAVLADAKSASEKECKDLKSKADNNQASLVSKLTSDASNPEFLLGA